MSKKTISAFLAGKTAELSTMTITGKSGSIGEVLGIGEHEVTVTDIVAETQNAPKDGEERDYVDLTRQLKVTFKNEDGYIIKHYSLQGYAKFTEKELAETIDTIGEDPDALKQLKVTAKQWSSMDATERMHKAFMGADIDPQNPGRGQYAVYIPTKMRVPSDANTNTCNDILGKLVCHADVLQDGEEMSLGEVIDNIKGSNLVIVVRPNKRGDYNEVAATKPLD